MSYSPKYFTEGEMVCKHCGELPPNGISPVLLEKLDQLRELVGEPINVTCMYRCPEHNAAVYRELGQPVVTNSQHVMGTGADIWCSNLTVDQLADYAIDIGFDGIGRYYGDQFVHVDCRDNGESPNYYTWTV